MKQACWCPFLETKLLFAALHVVLWDSSCGAVKTIQVFKRLCYVSQKISIFCQAFDFNTDEDIPGVLSPIQGSPVKETWTYWANSNKGS